MLPGPEREHRRNQVMTILAVVSSVFALLTFISGRQGMDCAAMPELSRRDVCLYSLMLMVAAALIQVTILWRRAGFRGVAGSLIKADPMTIGF
nr:CorA family divalent cation transporter [Synechococcus sp. RSCCF101]